MARYELTQTDDMKFVSRCKEGNFEAVVELLEAGADPNTKAYVYYKNRLLGAKYSSDWGKYIITHQSGERMMGTALHYAVMSERWEVVGLLLAYGASPTVRFNLPPHMPHEVTVEELAAKHGHDAITAKLFTLFRVWAVIPVADARKAVMLQKLPEVAHDTLRPYLLKLVRRHQEDPELSLLKAGGAAAAPAKPATPEASDVSIDDVDKLLAQASNVNA